MEKALAKGPHTAELLRDAACLYAIAGKPDAALRCLEQAVDKGFDPRRFANDNSFNSLKPNPAFVELVRRPAPAGGPTKATRLVDPIDELPAK
jgi:hypothetical protein